MNQPTNPYSPLFAAEVDAQADSLLVRAQEDQADQRALIESPPLESQYSAAVAAQLEVKQDQVSRIEDRLEELIVSQTVRIKQTTDQRPGRLSMPGANATWQQQLQRQQATLQRLYKRLEEVREIRDGMGVHSPKLEELAMRKARGQAPDLAAKWDEMREAQRGHQALMRKQEWERRQRQQGQREGPRRSLGLSWIETR